VWPVLVAVYLGLMTYVLARQMGFWVLVPVGVYVAAELLSFSYIERALPARLTREKATSRQSEQKARTDRLLRRQRARTCRQYDSRPRSRVARAMVHPLSVMHRS
jgi:hypothetical protein